MKKVFFIVGMVLLLAIWYFLFVRKVEAPKEIESQVKFETTTLQELAKTLGVKVEIRDSGYVDWTSDGKQIPLTSQQIILGTNGANGIGKYGDFTTDELMKVDSSFIDPLASKIKKYYLSKGFKESSENTNSKPNDLWFKNLGFVKDDVYCVNNLAIHSDPFAYLSCGTIDQKQLGYQTQFGSIYKHAQSQTSGPVPLIFRVQKVDGDFAIGSASSIGGWTWIAKRTSGKWNVVWEGQDIAICSDMQKYRVPKSIYASCFNATTGKTE